MADQKQVERLKHSVQEWNTWRQEHPKIRPDLSFADLRGTNLIRANLGGADLNGADFSFATLSYTNLHDTNLSDADLSFAVLSNTDLRGATLSDANLFGANLSDANLSDANFDQTFFSRTLFAWVDLSTVKGLETAVHNGPSSVDINSVVLPHDERTRLHFLRGVGFSDIAIEYLPSILMPAAIQYYSIFISYTHRDEIVARRLYQDLQNNGVRCWMAPHDMKIGDKIRLRIDEAIHTHEKLLLILSTHSVASQWVEHEVETALGKEQKSQSNVLFPIRLDDAVLKSTTGWASHVRLTRHIGDFTNWQDDAAYQQVLAYLMRDLIAGASSKRGPVQ